MRMLAGGYGGRAESTSTFERNLPSCTRHAKGWITDDVTANYNPRHDSGHRVQTKNDKVLLGFEAEIKLSTKLRNSLVLEIAGRTKTCKSADLLRSSQSHRNSQRKSMGKF